MHGSGYTAGPLAGRCGVGRGATTSPACPDRRRQPASEIPAPGQLLRPRRGPAPDIDVEAAYLEAEGTVDSKGCQRRFSPCCGQRGRTGPAAKGAAHGSAARLASAAARQGKMRGKTPARFTSLSAIALANSRAPLRQSIESARIFLARMIIGNEALDSGARARWSCRCQSAPAPL